MRRDHIGTNEKIPSSIQQLENFFILRPEAYVSAQPKAFREELHERDLGEMLENNEALKAEHALPRRLFILVWGGIISRPADPLSS